MNTHVIKTILVGAALGAALFLIPFFLLKAVVLFALFGLAIRFFSRHRHYRGPAGWSYADKIRDMSDQEYADLKDRWGRHGRHCGPRGSRDADTTTEEPS